MRSEIDSKYHSGEIRLWKSARKEKSVAVVVEAKSDEKFFQKFFDSLTTFFPVDGFQNVLDVIEDIENDIQAVLGLVDADFRHCVSEKLSSKNIFISDNHDVEMMTVNSDAWKEVVEYHCQKIKLSKFQKKHSKTLLEYILELSHPIACIRYLNYKKKLGLVFKTKSKDKYIFLDYSKFIEKESFEINVDKLIETIENKSQKQSFFKNNPAFLKEIKEICEKQFNLFDFCNGHDMVNILALALKKEVGNISISGQELEAFLIVAYRYDDFKKTEIFKDLKKWEKGNPNFILFRI